MSYQLIATLIAAPIFATLAYQFVTGLVQLWHSTAPIAVTAPEIPAPVFPLPLETDPWELPVKPRKSAAKSVTTAHTTRVVLALPEALPTTLKELKVIAKAKNVKGYSRMKRDELYALLKAMR